MLSNLNSQFSIMFSKNLTYEHKHIIPKIEVQRCGTEPLFLSPIHLGDKSKEGLTHFPPPLLSIYSRGLCVSLSLWYQNNSSVTNRIDQFKWSALVEYS